MSDDIRVGHGYDVHRTGEGDGVILAGVPIPWDRGLIAHSDGDVAVHALCDALLGAAALGDIGHHFPDTDPGYGGADSLELLERVRALLEASGYRVGNIDVTIVAEAPRLADHMEAMRETLAGVLAIPVDRVSVKATTHEGVGALGRSEGIAAHAVALISTRV